MKYLKEVPDPSEIDAYLDALIIKLRSGWSFSVSKRMVGITLQRKTSYVMQDKRFKELNIKYQTPKTARLYDVSRRD